MNFTISLNFAHFDGLINLWVTCTGTLKGINQNYPNICPNEKHLFWPIKSNHWSLNTKESAIQNMKMSKMMAIDKKGKSWATVFQDLFSSLMGHLPFRSYWLRQFWACRCYHEHCSTETEENLMILAYIPSVGGAGLTVQISLWKVCTVQGTIFFRFTNTVILSFHPKFHADMQSRLYDKHHKIGPVGAQFFLYYVVSYYD